MLAADQQTGRRTVAVSRFSGDLQVLDRQWAAEGWFGHIQRLTHMRTRYSFIEEFFSAFGCSRGPGRGLHIFFGRFFVAFVQSPRG